MPEHYRIFVHLVGGEIDEWMNQFGVKQSGVRGNSIEERRERKVGARVHLGMECEKIFSPSFVLFLLPHGR